MRVLPVFAAVLVHYIISIHYNNGKMNYSELFFLIGICLKISTKVQLPVAQRPRWCAYLQEAIFSFSVIQTLLSVFWDLDEIFLTHLLAVVRINEDGINFSIIQANLILDALAFVFFLKAIVDTVKSSSTFKSLLIMKSKQKTKKHQIFKCCFQDKRKHHKRTINDHKTVVLDSELSRSSTC